MIIEKIHIDNFGKLSNYTIELSAGLNTVFGCNEDGKTTLMSFIRLMFYGNCGKKSDICSNIRHRFRPFSEKQMGGSIDFSHAGKSYTLIKQFGKTAKADKIMLLDRALGKSIPISADKELGEEFFSLSSNAFERSIYIGSLPILEGDGYAELSSKLAAAVYTGDTGDSFEEIDERLAAAQAALRTPRGVGISDKLRAKRASLCLELEEAKKAESARKETAEQIEALKKREQLLISEFNKKSDALIIGELKKEAENREKYAHLLSSLKGFNREKLLASEALIGEYDALFAKISASKSLSLSQGGQDGISAAEAALSEATAELEKINKKLEENKAQSEHSLASLGENKNDKSIALMFVAAVLFFLSAAAGSFASFAFLGMLAPAIIFLTLAFTKKSARDKEKRAAEEAITELEKEEDELLKEQSALLGLVCAYKERVSLLNGDIQKQDSLHKKLKEEEAAASTRIAEITAILSALCPVPIREVRAFLLDAENKLLSLATTETLLSNSRHKELTDEQIAEKLSAADATISASEAEITALRSEAENIRVEIVRKEGDMKALLVGHKNISVLEREIGNLDDTLKKQDNHYEALTLARQQLSNAYYEMRRSFAPELNSLTAKYFSAITNGKYKATTVSNEFSVLVNGDGSLPHSSEYLSSGSRDQLDLCLRLALARLTGGEQRLPLMLDDVLIQYDEERARNAMRLISSYAADTQVLFFTCHKHIVALGNEFGSSEKRL